MNSLWREVNKEDFSWPIIESADDRWGIQSALDAVVADAYKLNRDQYSFILSSFSYSHYPTAPELCLSKFDELKTMGFETFCKKYDPYWDIPLNESLPEPAIDLPLPSDVDESVNGELALGMPSGKKKRARKRKK